MKINEKSNDELSKIKLSGILDTIENGNRPKGGIKDLDEGVPSLGGEHLTKLGGFNFKKLRLVSQEYYYSLKRGKIKQNDVLIVKDGATTGKVSFVDEDFPFQEAAVNEHVFILRGKKDLIHPKFLFYHIFSPFGQLQIMKNFRGAAIGGINTQFVKNYYIYLPSLKNQMKIVEIMEKAEKLKEWRAEADGLADEYLKSVFLEMFGDPVKNKKGWKRAKLSELGTWKSGGTPSRQRKEFFTGEIPWYTSGELNNTHISDSIENITEQAIENSNAKLIKPNSLLLGMYDTAALKSSITTTYSSCNQAIAYSELENKNSNIIYVYYAIQIGRKFFMSRQRGIRQKNLNLTMVKDTEIPLPHLELQNQFAEIVQQVETLKSYQSKSKQEIDNLFNTLMQKAFKGELVC
ncbi:restriction endonuclease subunit S [uncultured Methanobacterium sp.]|uniref:restriction endonuclease subunit S n=1 Tax=uncultured Methanobacterium sp. TaxID=176306 RepID=UPI002AA81D48|nr:restriction endonuclease subunit S [uncultured Methanobacterium sp.]